MTESTAQTRAARRGSIATLVGAWALYWVGLGAAVLVPPIQTFLRAKQAATGKSSLSLHGGEAGITVVQDGVTIYSAHPSTLETFAWVALPPLLIWAVWIWWGSRRAARVTATAPQIGAPLPQDGDRIDTRRPAHRHEQRDPRADQ